MQATVYVCVSLCVCVYLCALVYVCVCVFAVKLLCMFYSVHASLHTVLAIWLRLPL